MAAAPRPQTKSNRALWRAAGLLVSAGFMALVVYRSLQIPTVECEVCITFRGQAECRTVGGASSQEARAAAVTNACALISSGVTDTLACERTPPTKVLCSDKS